MNVSEATIQSVLMRWLLGEKNHEYLIPNSNQFFSWEADLISVNKSGLVHEFEIKLNIADYKRDARKHKHNFIGDADHSPAYFWYVTHDFEIEPPEKCGWLLVRYSEKEHRWLVYEKKPAPILNHWKPGESKQRQIARLLSWRLSNLYTRHFEFRNDSVKSPIDV